MTSQRRRRDDTAGKPIIYPTSDGKPMAETDLHRKEMARLIETLDAFLADRPDVYVSGNLLLYYEEGNPRASVAPDVFVAVGVPKHDRPIYKLWEEHAPPTVVIEVTSPSTRREDRAKKWALYARLGVGEYYLYDPLGEYLRPPFQGYRLDAGEYRAMTPDVDGALVSAELGLVLVLVDGRLRLRDRSTGVDLLSPMERAAAEAARAELEAARADAAERRVVELEALLRGRERDAT